MNEKALAAAERLEVGKAIDQTALISDLSHQLEVALGVIEEMETAKRELRSKLSRAEDARDLLRELLVEALQPQRRVKESNLRL